MHDFSGPIILAMTAIVGLLSMGRIRGPVSSAICAAIWGLIALILILPVRVPVCEVVLLSGWALAASFTFTAQWWVIRRLLRARRDMYARADRILRSHS